MKIVLCVAAALLSWGAAGGATAQTPVTPVSPAVSATSTPTARGTVAPTQRSVIEDDGVRIEETRVRGVVRRIVVQSKIAGASEYEIQVAPAGRDPAQERGGAGQRAWTLLRF